jgi:hypothetical protein
MGVVVAFGTPGLRVRRRHLEGFCEVTVFPGRLVDQRDALLIAGDRRKAGERVIGNSILPKGKRGK